VQYKNSGAIQSGIMNERDVITVGLKGRLPVFEKSRRSGYTSNFTINTEESEAAARRYCEDSTARFRV
jgi:hypothetical protein